MKIAGSVVEAGGVKQASLTITDGVITEVGAYTEAADHVFSPDHYIFPGFIDIHTHCRQDTSGHENYKEDYLTAGRAAINGGVTFLADMPNNPIPPVDRATYLQKLDLAKSCPIPALPYAAIGPTTEPFDEQVPYKAFMGPSIGQLFFDDNRRLEQALERYRGLSVSFHCEDYDLLQSYQAARCHEDRRPPICETTAIEFALAMIRKYDLKGKICHVSTAEGLRLVNRAKGEGTRVTAEVTPYHLYFNYESHLSVGMCKLLQMNPPLRSARDQGILKEAFVQELPGLSIDYFATDHAPHTQEEKEKGTSGVPHLDTFGSFLALAMRQWKITPVRVFELACRNPGEWIGDHTGRKVGRLLPGYEASLTVLKPRSTVELKLYTKCGWTPFVGLPQAVAAVFVQGQRVDNRTDLGT